MHVENQRASKWGTAVWLIGMVVLAIVAIPKSLLTWKMPRVPNQGPLSSTDAALKNVCGVGNGGQRVAAVLDEIPPDLTLWVVQTSKQIGHAESALALSILSWPRPAFVVEWPLSTSTQPPPPRPDAAFLLGNLEQSPVQPLQIGRELWYLPRMQP